MRATQIKPSRQLMRAPSPTRLHTHLLLALAALSSGARADDAAPQVEAQGALDAGVIVQAVVISGSKVAQIAPVQASLKATQPQSVITASFIEHAIDPTADFISVARIAPSVGGGVAANGTGLSESKVSLRGFQDGEYNITYDGIPFSDTNDPTHHSTSYFPARIIGGMVVERGPGNASNLGQATFGGSLNLFSKELSSSARFSPYLTLGAWNTRMEGAEVDSGKLAALGGGAFMLNYSHLGSDGYLSHNGVNEDNFQFKFEKTSGDTVWSAFSTWNKIRAYGPDKGGVTLNQAAQFGKNFSLNADPRSQDYFGYNYADKKTDFEYLRLQTKLAQEWAFDGTAYTYAYTNITTSSSDPTGATPNGTKAGPAGNTDVPGYVKTNDYRVSGAILKATGQFERGQLRVGLWTEHAFTTRSTLDYDWTLGGVPNPAEKTAPKNVKYEQNSAWLQNEPFMEFEWTAAPGLSITPGLKYVHFNRSIDALVNQDTRTPSKSDQTYTATLPFLSANQRINGEWSAYAQLARGFLAPPLSVQYVNTPDASHPAPQTSTNYQLGMVHASKQLSFDADLYYIDFNNKIASTGSGTDLVYFNLGGAVYKGVEAQATYALGQGFSVHANGSLNSAKTKDGDLWVAKVPRATAALGLMYKANGWNGALITKMVGATYMEKNENPAYHLGSYASTDLSLGYSFGAGALGFKRARAQLSLHNLLDRQDAVSAAANSKGAAYDQYVFQPQRSASVSLSADF
ncbi:MAG: TonB-dependent receptor [Pseudomonadota bacterium]